MSTSVVQLSDAVVPVVYDSYTAVLTPANRRLAESGILSRSEVFDTMARTGGRTLVVPFWNDLDTSGEPNYSNDDPDDHAVPDSVTTGTMNSRKAFVNNGWSEMNLVQELIGTSPMQHIRNRTGNFWEVMKTKRLGAILVGLRDSNVSKNASDMVLDITGGTGDAAVFNSNAFLDAAYTAGQNADVFTTIVVHSMIASVMAKEDEIDFVKDSEGRIILRQYKGLNVITTDDPSLVSGAGNARKFTSILLGRGSIGFGASAGTCLAFGEGTPKKPVEVVSSASAGNGGGQETLWERHTWVMHPYGFNWTDPAVPAEFSPTHAELNAAANWTRVVPRSAVPMAFLVSYAKAQA